MAAEKDLQLALVEEVEKYPMLYNYKLADYSRKDVTERAWSEIGNKIDWPVSDCKEKWRNIRSTFIRSLKAAPSGSKPRKPYYLSEHLTFIIPYVKPVTVCPNRGNIPSVEKPDCWSVNAKVEEKTTESAIEDSQDSSVAVSVSQRDGEQEETALPAASQLQGTRRRRTNELDATMISFLQKKIARKEEPETSRNQAMNHFFLSLLPEFDDMTDQQIRTFKIKVLQLLDEMKQNKQSCTPPPTNNEESSLLQS